MFLVVSPQAGPAVRQCRLVPLAKCTACRRGFSVRPAGIYPRRQFQLDVVAEVAAAVAIGGERPAAAARTAGASATSVRRWSRWIASLAPVADIVALTARLDPDAPAGAALPVDSPGGCAAILTALEQVGVALVRAGVACVERTGLGRLLGWQHRAHGIVCGLHDRLCFSTAMAPAPSRGPP